MNFFAHGLAYLDDPYFLAGTAVPDWLSVVDRPARVRSRRIEAYLQGLSEDDRISPQAGVACGAWQHLKDDDWFHGTRAFTELNAELGRIFRQALGPDDNFRAGFLGHIVTEMLLDRVLIEQLPGRLDLYYLLLSAIEPDEIEAAVNNIAIRPTEKLARLIPRFVEERFLFDYLDTQKLWYRLNQVMRRVKLPELPESIVEAIDSGYERVQQRAAELLPLPVLNILAEKAIQPVPFRREFEYRQQRQRASA